ncbi:MAG: MerR family transcriptional regulator [Deltaproteobacteria bacterium]|nr:MerR family transcriptional regulator [Deltaproteobacteria bacterium]
MLLFYTNRELSEKLGINLAKWKRWSREFLPPDPLGGMQSGYARQYHPDEAFTVNLGGHLVADLKFTIPEAKQILRDLNNWFSATGFYFDPKSAESTKEGLEKSVKRYTIDIFCKTTHDNNYYVIKGLLSKKPVQHHGSTVSEARYVEMFIGARSNKQDHSNTIGKRVLNITVVLERFLENMGRERASYIALS